MKSQIYCWSLLIMEQEALYLIIDIIFKVQHNEHYTLPPSVVRVSRCSTASARVSWQTSERYLDLAQLGKVLFIRYKGCKNKCYGAYSNVLKCCNFMLLDHADDVIDRCTHRHTDIFIDRQTDRQTE